MIGLRLRTLFKGKRVGKDAYGNRYYIERTLWPFGKHATLRRWVLYKGLDEASKVPAEWHAWLHDATQELPNEKTTPHYQWLKSHQPNLTGTPYAYNVSLQATNSTDKKKPRYYESWTPR